MAKKRQKTTRFSIQGFDLQHYRTTEQYTAAVQSLFDRATVAVAQSAASLDPDKPFSFDDFPAVKAEMAKITSQLATQLQATIESGSRKEWLFACSKNDQFLASIMDTSKLSKSRLSKMQDRNLDALQTFQQRKVDGMDLSQRVWRYVGQYRDQLECALDVGLGEGRSAQQLARDVKKNLQEPDRLFRRVRDKRGNLVLSKAARAYHPGQGVYRSSVKNAQRLTRSEINMAYRESDYLRWQQLDFVVGFEVMRSNHEPLCKCKMCDRLKGRYPKTFKFKGWHPQCMCYAVPILMDEETFDENEFGDLKAALYGTEYKKREARNIVVDVPDGFKAWVAENMEASKGWRSTPYFIKDNFKNGDLSKGLKLALPTPPVDPVQQQLEALMPSVEAARGICKEWGLSDLLKQLETAVSNRDVSGITNCISQITGAGNKYTKELSEYFRDAAQTLKEVSAAGVGLFPDEVECITRYLTNLSANKGEWATGASFYKSELDNLKNKLKQYKASPESQLSQAEKQLVSNMRTAIRLGDEWGVKTTEARNLLQTFLADPTDDNYWKLYDEQFKLDGRIRAAEKKVDKLIADSRDLIKEALALGLDSERVKLHQLIFNLDGRDKAVMWSLNKREINAAFKELQAIVEVKKKEKEEKDRAAAASSVAPFDNSRADNEEELEKALSTTKGKAMSHETANELRGNPNYVKGGGYRINCQSCVVAYELRRRGYDVEAQENTRKSGNIPYELSTCTEKAWLDESGNKPKKQRAGGWYFEGYKQKNKTYKQMMSEFATLTSTPGRYHIDFGWKGSRSGHIITMERFADGTMRVYDPQNGRVITDFATYAKQFALKWGIDILRVDTLRANPHYASGATKKSS